MTDELVEKVKECIVKYKVKDICGCIQDALDAGISPQIILQDGMVAGMTVIGDGFMNNTVFMPQMLVAAKTMQTGLEVLRPKLAAGDLSGPSGKAIVGSVLGDVHDIGKNLVTVMLQGQGLTVKDLGADVPVEAFTDEVDSDPDIKVIALSSSMTPTREALRETVAKLNEKGNRADFGVFVGGATMDQTFCEEIGADVYTSNAAACANRAKQYLEGTDIATVSREAKEVALADAMANQAVEEDEQAKEEGPKETPRHLRKNLTRIAREEGDVRWIHRNPLSQKDNYRETVLHGLGHPDRFVDQYEYFNLVWDPIVINSLRFGNPPDENGYAVDGWGIVSYTPPGAAGSHPMNDPEHRVIKDFMHWEDYVKPPQLEFPDSVWEPAKEQMKAIREKDDQFTAIFMAPGLFERTHELFDMKETLEMYYQEPERMHDLIEFITDWEVEYIEEIFRHIEPELLFHHDDWGTALNSFLDPATHRDFFLEPYKRIYGTFKKCGGEFVVHHSDSYAANLVEIDIEAGTDTWQGCIEANNVPELIDKYGDRFTFMGGIDEAVLDDPSSTAESAMKYAAECIDKCGSISFIPCQTRGLGMTIIPERYGQVSQVIAKKSKEYF